MSSLSVRQLILSFLETNSTETIIDITGHFEDVRQLLSDEGVQPDAPWMALDFVGGSEEPVMLTANNTQGLYREIGSVLLHLCEAETIGAGHRLVARADVLLNLFRGARIGGVVVDSLEQLNTGPGATLEAEAGYVSGTISVNFHYDHTPNP